MSLIEVVVEHDLVLKGPARYFSNWFIITVIKIDYCVVYSETDLRTFSTIGSIYYMSEKLYQTLLEKRRVTQTRHRDNDALLNAWRVVQYFPTRGYVAYASANTLTRGDWQHASSSTNWRVAF